MSQVVQTARERNATTTVNESGERSGIPRIVAGVFFLVLALGWTIGLLFANFGSASLLFFRAMAIGLGGMFAPVLPPLALWLGALLCVSSRRVVSVRECLFALLCSMCLMAIFTLIPVVQGAGSLMDYIQTLNVRRNLSETSTLRAYIDCAYNMHVVYQPSGSIPVGGGVLGMLLAYPLWSVLGIVGGIALCGIILIVSLLLLFHVPVRKWIRGASDRAEARRLAREQEEARERAEYEAQQKAWEQPLPNIPPPTVVAPAQQVVYEDLPPQTHAMPDRNGFVQAQPGVLRETYFPETTGFADTDDTPAQPEKQPLPPPDEPPAEQQQSTPEIPPEPEQPNKPERHKRTVRVDDERRIDGTPALEPRQISMPMPSNYQRPTFDLLVRADTVDKQDTALEDKERARRLEATLASFNISAEVRRVVHGPAITQFALRLSEGINVRRVTAVIDNIAMEMEARGSVRAEVPIPGTAMVGIEVPNEKITMVTLREVLDSPEMRGNSSPTVVALGKDITGRPVMCDLSAMPHLLIAGATGSGKSVCINCVITSILYRSTPEQVRMIMIDPKTVELQPYNGIPHLLAPVVTDPKKAAVALDWAVQEMMDRYAKMRKRNVRSIAAYNHIVGPDEPKLPSIIIVIDELYDLMLTCRKSVEESISRLSALARAAGLHLIIATQRPSVNVITGVIKANIPSRIAFAVTSNIDSRVIIDVNGAEKLLGKGDMLYAPGSSSEKKRVQGCFVSDTEVVQVTDYVRERNKTAYDMDFLEHMETEEANVLGAEDDDDAEAGEMDALLKEAADMAIESGQMSISMLQRRLRVGYARAGRLIDEMTRRGIISASEGSKPRKTIMTREEYSKMLL